MTSEQHLGDSLAALIDGELSHDHRERVLAHLVTCVSCKAEVEAQRALKSAFAQCPLPAPSAGLLARLQGLPGGGLPGGGPVGGGPPSAGGVGEWSQELFAVPRRRDSLLSVSLLGGQRGFPVHRPGDGPGRSSGGLPAEERPIALPGGRAQRGHRFAFAAAGAFSLAAFAIGGALAAAGPGSGPSTGGGSVAKVATGGGPSASPVRTASASREDPRPEAEPLHTGGALNVQNAPVSYLGHSVSVDMAALLAARQNALGEPLAPLAASAAPPTATGDRSPEPHAGALGAAASEADALGVVSPR